MRISHKSKAPLDHVLNVLQQRDSTVSGNSYFRKMVTYKAKNIANEFTIILQNEDRWRKDEDALRSIFPDQFYLCLVTCTGKGAAEYHSRIVSLVEEFPALMCFLVVASHDIVCYERKRIARLILATPYEQLDVTTAKVSHLFSVELTAAANTGLLVVHVYQVIVRWADRVGITTQPIESGNSAICFLTGNAPRMEKPLTCARFASK